MTLRRARGRRIMPNNHSQQPHTNPSSSNRTQQNPPSVAQPSDYESDLQNYYLSDNQSGANMPSDAIPPPTRTNEELNLAVLRRHNPAITSILSLAPYAV